MKRVRDGGDIELLEIQRILTNHYYGSLVLTGIFLALNAAGFAGLYTIGKDFPLGEPGVADSWKASLGVLLFLANIAIFTVWLREYGVKKRAVHAMSAFPRLRRHAGDLHGGGMRRLTDEAGKAVYQLTILAWGVLALAFILGFQPVPLALLGVLLLALEILATRWAVRR